MVKSITDVPFLKVESLPDEWQSIAEVSETFIEMTLHSGRWGSQLLLFVRVLNLPDWHRRFGVKLKSANMIALEQRLGKNLLKWPGQSFGLHVEKFYDSARRPRRFLCVDGARQRG